MFLFKAGSWNPKTLPLHFKKYNPSHLKRILRSLFGQIFEDFEGNLEEALEILNMEAEEKFFKFKIGSTSHKA